MKTKRTICELHKVYVLFTECTENRALFLPKTFAFDTFFGIFFMSFHIIEVFCLILPKTNHYK